MEASTHIVLRSTYLFTKLPYFLRNFHASIIHAAWAVLNLLQWRFVSAEAKVIYPEFPLDLTVFFSGKH